MGTASVWIVRRHNPSSPYSRPLAAQLLDLREQPKSTHAIAELSAQYSKKKLQGFVRDHAKPGAEYAHPPVNHLVSRYVSGMAHSNGIESFRASLKRAHCGMFHHMPEKHLHRCVPEFAARMAGKRLTYSELIAD